MELAGNHLRSMPVRGIAAGAQSSMALSIGGHVFCWGCNGRGRLGLGPAYDQEQCVDHVTVGTSQGDFFDWLVRLVGQFLAYMLADWLVCSWVRHFFVVVRVLAVSGINSRNISKLWALTTITVLLLHYAVVIRSPCAYWRASVFKAFVPAPWGAYSLSACRSAKPSGRRQGHCCWWSTFSRYFASRPTVPSRRQSIWTAGPIKERCGLDEHFLWTPLPRLHIESPCTGVCLIFFWITRLLHVVAFHLCVHLNGWGDFRFEDTMIAGRVSSNTMEIHQPIVVGTHVQIEHRTYMINVCMQWFVFFMLTTEAFSI